MTKAYSRKIAVVPAATILLLSILLTACEGRKMSNMTPLGETVEVVVEPAETPADTISAEASSAGDVAP